MTVFRIFYEIAPWYALDANTNVLLQALGNNPVTLENLIAVSKTIDGLALREDITKHMTILNSIAGRHEAIDRAYQQKGKALLAQADRAERMQLKQEITLGKSTFSVRLSNGQRRVYDGDTGDEVQFSPNGPRKSTYNWFLEGPIEDIRAIRDQLVNERSARGKSVDELRREVRPAGAVRDQQITDDFKTSVSINGQQQRQEAVEEVTLLDPRSGVPFTKQTIIQYLNSGSGNENAKALLVRSGRVDKARERALLKLLGKI
jgi:hypothetical protein